MALRSHLLLAYWYRNVGVAYCRDVSNPTNQIALNLSLSKRVVFERPRIRSHLAEG
jgi:hypothetical protein